MHARPQLATRLLLAFGLLFSGNAWAARTAFQIRCEDDIGKTVTMLTAQQGGYTIDGALSYRALTRMRGESRPNTYVLGLTRTESRVEIGLAGPLLQDAASGYECVAPQISVKLFYVPVVIYISSEFPPGGCPYQAILRHELRHLKAYMDHLPKVETLARAALARRFEAKPLYAPSGTARLALEHEINTGWLPYIKAEMGKVEAQQAAIDSPEEYARLARSCNGEIRNTIAPGRRSH